MSLLSQKGVETLQNAATATGDGTVLPLAGASSVVVQVTGTFVGTITWEANVDGTNFDGIALADLNSTTRARALTVTAPGLFLLDAIAGLVELKARISAYTSGSITVTAQASQ